MSEHQFKIGLMVFFHPRSRQINPARAGPALVRLSMPLWPRKQPLAALPRSDAAATINNNLRGARPTNSRSILL